MELQQTAEEAHAKRREAESKKRKAKISAELSDKNTVKPDVMK